jgi:hypothetical protein
VLIRAAAKEAPKVTRYEATTRGSVTVDQKVDQGRSAVRTKIVASGSKMIRLKYVQVIPRERPKPGSTPRDLDRIISPEGSARA